MTSTSVNKNRMTPDKAYDMLKRMRADGFDSCPVPREAFSIIKEHPSFRENAYPEDEGGTMMFLEERHLAEGYCPDTDPNPPLSIKVLVTK